MPVIPVLIFFALLGQEPFVIKDTSTWIAIDADVRTDQGPVADLEKDSFRVYDNGRPKKLAFFAPEEQPLDMILLLDNSHSMRPVLAHVAEAAHAALAGLRAGDRLCVMAFSTNAYVVTDFTADFAEAEKSTGQKILSQPVGGGTLIQSALADAARHFPQLTEPRRRAIVIVTDDDGSREDPAALKELWGAGVVLMGVVVPSPDSFHAASINLRYAGMRNIAHQTGGDSVETRDAADGVQEMVRRLRTRYSMSILYFQMPDGKSGDEHRLEVQLTRAAAARHPGAVVRARTGYIAQ